MASSARSQRPKHAQHYININEIAAAATAEKMSSQQTTTPDHVHIIPFCAHLPSQNGNASQSSDETFGVVGTITLRGQSAVVWFGWGDIEITTDEEPLTKERCADELASVGSGELVMTDIFSISFTSK